MNDLTTVEQNNGLTTKVFDTTLLLRFVSFLDCSPKTVETYKKALKQFFVYLQVNQVLQPTRETVLQFKESLKATHKPTTIQNYITATRIFFKWLNQEGLYSNIAEHIKGAKLDREHKKDYLTSTQVKAVLGAVDTTTLQGVRDYALLSLMVTGGLRTIEVIRANVGDLRTVGDNTVLYVQGKGKVEKTDYIKLSPKVEGILRCYLSYRGATDSNEPLFVSTSNNNKGQRLTTRTISAIVKARLHNAGFNSERLTAHSLRHTAVTLSLLAGRDITEVQQFARHANITTTMIYNHALDKAKNSCSEAITNSIF